MSDFYHLCFVVQDIKRTIGDLSRTLELTAYHRLDSLGVRTELVDIAVQAGFLDTWSPGTAPMPALDLPLEGPP
jgi:hypothetical protein